MSTPTETYAAANRDLDDDPQACWCHQSHAMVSPFHSGHCCFWPATQTCHPDEVAAWEAADRCVHPASARTITS